MTLHEGAEIAGVAALIGDPTRARMLSALMSGLALTATELALEADVAPSTASSHLAQLTSGNVLRLEKQGRHRYYRLGDEEIAELLESLMGVAARAMPRPHGPADPALRMARVCYDHLAGERGVWLLSRLRERKLLTGRDSLAVSRQGQEFFASFGVDLGALTKLRRPLCRTCLDWSERRLHLGGALGAAILQRLLTLRWARREPVGRAIAFKGYGAQALAKLLG